MKPILIKISGINSFNNEQIIDFSKLYNKGIFGIFGITGSGKSSIIDGITLALYGKINRYEGKTGFKEFININREDFTAKVYFEFSIKNGSKDNIYSVERHFKKDNKGSIRTSLARLLLINENCIISEKSSDISNQIEKIIGLKYDDFIRAVILPQGKFSEFLMLENKEKRSMLERIFMLEKYGQKLTDKINDKKRIIEKNFSNIEEKLKELKDVNEDKIEDNINLILLRNVELESCLRNLNYSNETYKNLNEILKLKEELQYYTDKKTKLLYHTKKIKDTEEILYKAQKFDLIKDFLYDLKKIEENILNEKKVFLNLQKNIEESDIYYNKISKKYENLKIEKEEKINNLKEKSLKLEQDIIIKTNLQSLENQIKEKSNNLHNYEQELNNINIKLESLNNEKNNNILILNNILEFIKNNKIKSEFKNKLENAVKLQEKYTQDLENISIKSLKINEIKNSINKLNSEKEQVNSEIIELNENIKSYNEKIKCLKEKQDISQNKLIEYEKNYSFLENEYKTLCQEKIIFDKLNLNKKNFEFELKKIEKNLELTSKKVLNLQEKLSYINNIYNKNIEDSIIFKIAKNLSKGEPCPVCGSKEHPTPMKSFVSKVTKTLELELNDTELQLKNLITQNQEDINKKFKIELELKNILEKIEELKFKVSESILQEKEKYLHKLSDKINNLKINIKNYALNLQETINFNEKQTNDLNNLNIKFSEIITNIENNKNYLKILQDELCSINISILENQIQNIKEEMEISDFIKVYSELKNLEKILENKEQEKSEIEENLNNLNYQIDICKNRIINLEKNIIIIKTSISENQDYKQNILNQLGENLHLDISQLKKFLNDINYSIDEIKKQEENLYKLKNELYDKKIDLEKKYNSSLNTLKILNEDKALKEIKLFQKLNQNNFSSIKDAEKSFLSKEKQDLFQSEINRFNEKMQDANLNISRITEILKLKNSIDKTCDEIKNEIATLEDKINNLKNLQKIKIETITTLKINLNDLIIKLNTKNNLLKSFQNEIYMLDLIKELSNLTKGGVFVEHIAINQLNQIVMEAGQRLKLMTNNKFSISLKGSEFIIKDYHNGGLTRSVKSLSGGEVFMTSLSLAIALSSKIQLNNQAPLETLFLDEGFGTLDSATLDTVVYSLENLQSQNVNVGIITHIEELKNRVHSKILVDFDYVNRGAKIILN